MRVWFGKIALYKNMDEGENQLSSDKHTCLASYFKLKDALGLKEKIYRKTRRNDCRSESGVGGQGHEY